MHKDEVGKEAVHIHSKFLENTGSWLLSNDCKVALIGSSCLWIFAVQVLVLSERFVEPLRGRASSEEVSTLTQPYGLIAWPSFLLSLSLLLHCSVTRGSAPSIISCLPRWNLSLPTVSQNEPFFSIELLLSWYLIPGIGILQLLLRNMK